VLSWRKNLENGSFSGTLTGNINNMSITDVKNGDLNEETFFGERDKAFLLASAPDSKFTLNVNYERDWFNAGVGLTRFSKVELLDFQVFEDPADLGYASFADLLVGATDTYDPKLVTDLVLGFRLSPALKLNVGANNLFNVYPDQQDDWVEGGGYWDAVQMGFGGAYYYSRLNFQF
jgi:iron complex outermembrane receptor protein